MTTDRELMQQALNVLKIFVDGGNSAWARKIIEIKEALRARLAQPEQEIESDRDHVEDDGCPTEKAVLQRFWREHQKQEPDYETKFIKDWNEGKVRRVSDGKRMVPQRDEAPAKAVEWQGLTDEEIREFEIWLDDEEEKHGWNPPADIVKYIEARLKEKNT